MPSFLRWLPAVVWLVVIFVFSTDYFSSGQTSRFIGPLIRFFFDGLSPQEVERLHFIIRKAGHAAEYFILALLTCRSLDHGSPVSVRAKITTAVFVLIAALTDEFHQGLTASRGASIVDVSYDCFGSVSALWLITLNESRRLRSYPFL